MKPTEPTLAMTDRRRRILDALTADEGYSTRDVEEATGIAGLSSDMLIMANYGMVERFDDENDWRSVRRYYWRLPGAPIADPDDAEPRAPQVYRGPRHPELAEPVRSYLTPAAQPRRLPELAPDHGPRAIPAHGTVSRWMLGDRCEACEAAGARYQANGGRFTAGALA